MPPLGDFIWTTAAAFLTFCIFSFLYKDNPFYKFAEHLVVGVSAGYFTMLLYFEGFMPKLYDPVFNQGKIYYLIPGILGVLMWTRFTKKWSWVSRYPIAATIGIGTGVSIPLEMQTKVVQQLRASMTAISFNDSTGINSLLVAIGVFCALVYFFFSKEHKGIFGGVAKIGIWILMIGFGTGFGLTVMGRVSLLIDRVKFLAETWWPMTKAVIGGLF